VILDGDLDAVGLADECRLVQPADRQVVVADLDVGVGRRRGREGEGDGHERQDEDGAKATR
jgi:hypothetical protein